MKTGSIGHLRSLPRSGDATRSAYVRAAMLCGFEELIAEAGGDAIELTARVGIPPRALRDPDLIISWTAVGALMEVAAEELQRPSLGLEWLRAAPVPLLNFGAIALIARFTKTIDEWCLHSRNYWHWHTNASHAELLEPASSDALTLRVRFSTMIPPSRHQVEYILGGVCSLLRTLTPAADDGIEVVRFRHLRPKDTSLYESLFPCPVEFGCRHNDLVYHRHLHEQPIALAFDAFDSWLPHYVEARTWTIPDYDESARSKVEIAIPSLIGTSFCKQPHIAEMLSLSAKTLQRQLASEGVGFAALLDKTRERMARQLLAESDAHVGSIAGLLGYGETGTFTKAVRRWTKMTPLAFRNEARRLAEST